MPGSAVRNALGTVATWTFLAGCGYIAVVHPGEVRRVGFWLLGTTPEAMVAAAQPPALPRSQRRDEGTRRPSTSPGSVELRAASNGHFHAIASMNGSDVDVMVDTGATIVALTWEDAERAGIYVQPADFTHRVSTANGSARVAPVTIDAITIGGITVRNVQGAVTERGRLATTLLGMSFLGRLKRTEMRAGTLVLEQ